MLLYRMATEYPLRIGLFSIGLDTYWPQFNGLRERLEQYNRVLEQRLTRPGVEVENLGIVDSLQSAVAGGHRLRSADVSIIFLHVATYALSATVLPVVRRARCPVVLLNLAPGAAIDYVALNQMPDRAAMTGEWLAWCQACPIPEIANVFRRAGIALHQVSGLLQDDPEADREIAEWVEASQVMHSLEHNRLGLLGHYYSGMLDIYTDLTAQCIALGGQIHMLEADELSALREQVSPSALRAKLAEFSDAFEIGSDCLPSELERAAVTSVALDALVEQHQLGSLAYYHRGTGNLANEDTMSSVILGTSLLTARHIPVAGEYEVKNANAMKIMDGFGAGGSFSEFYGTDFHDDVVLLGHDGPGHLAMAEGRPKVRPLRVYHGKVGHGLSVEMSVRRGPVTLLSVAEGESGKLRLIVAEGASVAGPILEIGNTNSRYRFSLGARRFVEQWSAAGPAHHCAIGIGHIASKVCKLASLLGAEFVQVC